MSKVNLACASINQSIKNLNIMAHPTIPPVTPAPTLSTSTTTTPAPVLNTTAAPTPPMNTTAAPTPPMNVTAALPVALASGGASASLPYIIVGGIVGAALIAGFVTWWNRKENKVGFSEEDAIEESKILLQNIQKSYERNGMTPPDFGQVTTGTNILVNYGFGLVEMRDHIKTRFIGKSNNEEIGSLKRAENVTAEILSGLGGLVNDALYGNVTARREGAITYADTNYPNDNDKLKFIKVIKNIIALQTLALTTYAYNSLSTMETATDIPDAYDNDSDIKVKEVVTGAMKHFLSPLEANDIGYTKIAGFNEFAENIISNGNDRANGTIAALGTIIIPMHRATGDTVITIRGANPVTVTNKSNCVVM